MLPNISSHNVTKYYWEGPPPPFGARPWAGLRPAFIFVPPLSNPLCGSLRSGIYFS